ncbi:hypothetical protein [Clostridium saccharoperbutylacetonicum]|uniref:Uncharacterized protein n=4 Tax=Clostridium saccharoperbutylacetonicum TaxID=36745 RepID=M1MRG4_9CLOT|nr:hypothetical protein [Clostridium saccharoperbutylacetonicum]AGF57336.1 hypothetical protein Cspa_c35750 [Clostridium saccharoperbutylacetonicum N1-4(HMT)]AQR96030.1 hypothetical protein CLSAP_33480 [Clostridium saccharoperbutylacetonicum]NRT61901.1 hypothetical protein [Clostridium saccharoperbutylacetonicum]NSB25228.1 hypothetical protein [Clostridium saccharoperbutylacetonicum]NSB31898.1 hypothetical protein [Clostridium saccharoperbutylacetonicum]
MNENKNTQRMTHYFIYLFVLIMSIDIVTYMLFPVIKNNLAFLLIGLFTIALDVILLLLIRIGINWARWTFIISLIMKCGMLVINTLDNFFIFFNFNTKYIILILYFLIICVLTFSKDINKFFELCSQGRYYVDQCNEYIKTRYNSSISLNHKFSMNSLSDNCILMAVNSAIDNCDFDIIIDNALIYDNYFERHFNDEINAKIKYNIKKYALKSNESYTNKLLNINNGSNYDRLEFNIDSSLNLFDEYKTKLPPYEVFYELNSSKGNFFNFIYSMTPDYNDLEFNVQYIYSILDLLKSFNYRFDIINFYDRSKDTSNDKIHNDSKYIIRELTYPEACDILDNQDLSLIKDKIRHYIMNSSENL